MRSLALILDGVAGAVLIAFSILLTPLLRPWRLRWGATRKETELNLPGDEIVSAPRVGWTHAVTIRASAHRIWPWIVQIGCTRGGWYSYDLLDNGGRPSADHVLPEHQTIHVGDTIPLEPKGNFGIPVAAIEPESTLVLGGKLPASPENPIWVTWTFALLPVDKASTRLISRWRAVWTPSLFADFAWGIMTEAIGFVMDRKMLLEIKRRVESQTNFSA